MACRLSCPHPLPVLALILSPLATQAQNITSAVVPPPSQTSTFALTSTFQSEFAPEKLEAAWRNMPDRFLNNDDEESTWLFPAKPTIELDPTASSPEPQTQTQAQTQQPGHQGLVMRAVKRTLQDQKELYLTPFKPSNFKWDALVLGGTAALLASDRHIEKHIGTDHYTFYQATSDVAIAGLGATLGGVWIWGLKGNHPHAKETGLLELETLVNTFLIYTPMQLVAGRQRPGEGNGNGDFFQHHNINTSFPGGHAMFTFAMATVLSHEYSQKWVQVLAYSAASIVTVSRFMARDHWSSDMFVGAALGIGIGAHIFHAHCDPTLSDSCKHHTRWIF
jgi:hypothetical protein